MPRLRTLSHVRDVEFNSFSTKVERALRQAHFAAG